MDYSARTFMALDFDMYAVNPPGCQSQIKMTTSASLQQGTTFSSIAFKVSGERGETALPVRASDQQIHALTATTINHLRHLSIGNNFLFHLLKTLVYLPMYSLYTVVLFVCNSFYKRYASVRSECRVEENSAKKV